MSDRIFWDRIFKSSAPSPWQAVTAFVDEKQREGLHLEFKTTNARNGVPTTDDQKNLGKSLSAFANSAGGVLLFGVKTKGDEADTIKPIAELANFASRIGDLTRDRVDPPLARVEATPIADPEDATRGLVAIRIPEGVGGPYRARNAGEASEKYYQRGVSSSEVISHKVLAALFGVPPLPVLRLRLAQKSPGNLYVVLENAGRGIARDVRVAFEFKDHLRNTLGGSDNLSIDLVLPYSDWTHCKGFRHAIYPGRQNRLSLYPYDEVEFIVVHFKSRFEGQFRGTISLRIDCAGAQPAIVRDADVPTFVNGTEITLPGDVG